MLTSLDGDPLLVGSILYIFLIQLDTTAIPKSQIICANIPTGKLCVKHTNRMFDRVDVSLLWGWPGGCVPVLGVVGWVCPRSWGGRVGEGEGEIGC